MSWARARHGTAGLTVPQARHGPSKLNRAVPGQENRHGVLARHGTRSRRAVPGHGGTVPCSGVPVPGRHGTPKWTCIAWPLHVRTCRGAPIFSGQPTGHQNLAAVSKPSAIKASPASTRISSPHGGAAAVEDERRRGVALHPPRPLQLHGQVRRRSPYLVFV